MLLKNRKYWQKNPFFVEDSIIVFRFKDITIDKIFLGVCHDPKIKIQIKSDRKSSCRFGYFLNRIIKIFGQLLKRSLSLVLINQGFLTVNLGRDLKFTLAPPASFKKVKLCVAPVLEKCLCFRKSGCISLRVPPKPNSPKPTVARIFARPSNQSSKLRIEESHRGFSKFGVGEVSGNKP